MLVKVWFVSSIVARPNKHEIYNNEYKHTSSLNLSVEHK